MASTSEFRNGLCIRFNNDIYTVVEFQHVKPGKGGAFVRTRLKNLTSGRVIENTFLATADLNIVRVERKPFQFLYKDDNGYHFMDTQNYDQVAVQESMLDAAELLKEGQEVEVAVESETGKILYCEMPPNVVLQVTYTEKGIRGDTATNVTKPATVETGATVNVPLFINEGDLIKIDTRTGAYSERVKS
jgi:elongation factor P